MRIGIVTPAPAGSKSGNRVTALRWARILKKLGHRVHIEQTYMNEPCDVLIALHARRSSASIERFHHQHAEKPIIVALTGTDLYRDLRASRPAQESLELATRIIVLQPKALDELRPDWRSKTRVIYQSVSASKYQSAAAQPSNRHFDVCVIGHLRPVKDPFRTALAARFLPAESRVRILHAGGAMTKAMAGQALREMKLNPRYHWLGELPRWRVNRILKQSRLCVLSSRIEGGANVLGEAIVASTPALASHIAGSVGILGSDYPGYFEVGDTRELARLLGKAESDPSFLSRLKDHCERLMPLFDPAREEAAWEEILFEVSEERFPRG